MHIYALCFHFSTRWVKQPEKRVTKLISIGTERGVLDYPLSFLICHLLSPLICQLVQNN